MTNKTTEPPISGRKLERAMRAALLGVGLVFAPFGLTQQGLGAVAALAVAAGAVAAAVSRLPSRYALFLAGRRSQRYLEFSSIWTSSGGILFSALMVLFPALGAAAGIPIGAAHWGVIAGGAISALANLVVLVSSIASKPTA